MTSIRDKFAADFGEDQAAAIETAAVEHENNVHDKRGDDPFKWALCICIGYDCMEKDHYRAHHGITVPWTTLRIWIKAHAELNTHNGDVDYISLAVGKYNEFMPAGSTS